MRDAQHKGRLPANSRSEAIELDTVAASFCGLFDHVPGITLWVKDRNGRYRWGNRGLLMNYALEKLEELLGKTDYDLSPRHLADQFRVDDNLVLAGKAVVNRIELVGRFDHTAHWSITNKVPLRNRNGKILGTAGISRPMDEQEPLTGTLAGELTPCLEMIRRRSGEVLSNKELAKAACLSLRAFERKFLKYFGLSPQQYIMRVRVRMACSSLVYTRKPLSEIATLHGFCDQSHFTREFRRQLGMTPRRYRLDYQEANA